MEIRSKPCDYPLYYSIGTLDSRFNLSLNEAIETIKSAEYLWENSSGRNLFEYSPEGELKINFIYDERQKITNELIKIESEVNQDKEMYLDLEATYTELKNKYDSDKVRYDMLVSEFKNKQDSYQNRVINWNKGPRNNENNYIEIEEERVSLEKEILAIKEIENEINSTAIIINKVAQKLNSIAKNLDLKVEEYNIVGAQRGDTFTGGLYYSDGEIKNIEIFEFENRKKLLRILAHELGHALGIEHTSDKTGIMYKLNLEEEVFLADSDLFALESVCNAK